jgi:hypothetical protein
MIALNRFDIFYFPGGTSIRVPVFCLDNQQTGFILWQKNLQRNWNAAGTMSSLWNKLEAETIRK